MSIIASGAGSVAVCACPAFPKTVSISGNDFKTIFVLTDKINSGYYLNIDIKEEMIARYGISKNDVISTISLGVAGGQISTFIDSLERYPITLRFETTQKKDLISLENLQVKTKLGFQPLKMFANLEYEEGPSVIKSEKALNVNFIYITTKDGISANNIKKKQKSC